MKTLKIYISFIFYKKFYSVLVQLSMSKGELKKNHLHIMLTGTKWIGEVMNCGFSPPGN